MKLSKNPEAAHDRWALLTNHGGVLVFVALHPEITVRRMALALDLSERTVLRILADLTAEGYVTIAKAGRRNRYTINVDKQLRMRESDGIPLSRLLLAFGPASDTSSLTATLPPPGLVRQGAGPMLPPAKPTLVASPGI